MLRPAVCVALLCISAPCASFNPALECRPEKRPPFPSRFEHHLARAGADAAAETKAESGAESERKVGPRSQLGLRGGAEGRAGGLREPHFAPNLAAVLAGTGLAYYANNYAAGWRLVRGGLGGGLVRGVGWGPIMGSGSLGLVASLALPHLAVPFFCGTLAGTASTNVISSLLQLWMLGTLSAVGLRYFDASGTAVGMGGRLGVVAQVACSLTVLITGLGSGASYLNLRLYSAWKPLLVQSLPQTFALSLVGAILTRIFRTRPRFGKISSPVAAASTAGVLAALTLPRAMQGPVYAGAFVAMSAPNVLRTHADTLGAVTLSAIIQVALSGVLVGGWSGKLGSASCLGVYLWTKLREIHKKGGATID